MRPLESTGIANDDVGLLNKHRGPATHATHKEECDSLSVTHTQPVVAYSRVDTNSVRPELSTSV